MYRYNWSEGGAPYNRGNFGAAHAFARSSSGLPLYPLPGGLVASARLHNSLIKIGRVSRGPQKGDARCRSFTEELRKKRFFVPSLTNSIERESGGGRGGSSYRVEASRGRAWSAERNPVATAEWPENKMNETDCRSSGREAGELGGVREGEGRTYM